VLLTQDRIRSFGASDKSRRIREEDLNNLEGTAYRYRELITDDEFQSFTLPQTIKEIETLLKSTVDWLSDDDAGGNADSKTLKAKLEELKGLVEPIKDRRNEASKRPELTTFLKDALSQAKSMIDLVKDTIRITDEQNLEMEKQRLASAAESTSTTAVPDSEASTAPDPLADLEQELPSTTSSVEEQATILPVPAVAPYSQEDLEDLNDVYGRVSEWLEEHLSLQETKKPWETPAFKGEELQKKAKDLNDVVMEVLQKSMKGSGKGSGKKKRSKTKKAKPTTTEEVKPPASFMAGVVDKDEL
jgi:hypoxia up-regulated 1